MSTSGLPVLTTSYWNLTFSDPVYGSSLEDGIEDGTSDETGEPPELGGDGAIVKPEGNGAFVGAGDVKIA